MPSFPDEIAPLHGDRATLRLSAERDIPEILIAHQDDPELHLRLGEDRPPSGAQLGRRSEEEAEGRRVGDGVVFTIVAPGADECLGEVEVLAVEWDHRRAAVAVWLAPGARGRGLGSEALSLAARWLIGELQFARVELFADPSNHELLAAARRAGFSSEGVLHGHRLEHGRRIDSEVLSLIAEDVA